MRSLGAIHELQNSMQLLLEIGAVCRRPPREETRGREYLVCAANRKAYGLVRRTYHRDGGNTHQQLREPGRQERRKAAGTTPTTGSRRSLPPVTTGGISDMFPLDRLELITLAQFEQVVRNNRIPSAKGLGYNAVGLAGEAGEFSNKVKRLIAEKGTP